MEYFLVTKWFGSFLVDNKERIIKKNLFSQKKEEIVQILLKIRNQEILDEEKDLACNNNPIVTEKRLSSIGELKINHPLFRFFQPDPESFSFSKELLHDVLEIVAEKQVLKDLSLPDYQVIQQVNALDELQHIANVLSERIAAWNMYPGNKDLKKPLINVIDCVDDQQSQLKKQIESAVRDIAPNVTEIIGSMLAARLISHAGSLRKLAMLPSSSIQLLGAEKALFRFKKKGGKPPKHGVIFQHPYICKAPFKSRGKHARLIAAKLSIAAKADMFTKRFIAPTLKNELSDQISSSD